MLIGGLQKLSLLDYPNKMSCVIFTVGCNFNCPYCHNSGLLYKPSNLISEEEVFDYLEKRKKLLDGVVVSGGEATLQCDLKRFIKKIKKLGFCVKLDTNGSNPKLMKELLDEKLIDYVAMDIKNSLELYDKTTESKVVINNIKETIKILKSSKIDYEFRTTIMKEFHDINSIESICKLVDDSKYYLQNYKESEGVLKKIFTSFSDNELIEIRDKLNVKYPNLIIRGL